MRERKKANKKMKTIDIDKMVIFIMKKYAESPLDCFDIWLIKKLTKTKIDSTFEWITLNAIASNYYNYYMSAQIESYDKEHHANVILECLENFDDFVSKMSLVRGGEGIVEDWYKEMETCKEEIKDSLKKFLLNQDRQYYDDAISKINFYLEKHQMDYGEWKSEIDKYLSGMKKSRILIGFLLACGLFFGLQFCVYHEIKNQNILEYQEEYEETSLEEEVNNALLLIRKK